MRTEPTTTRPSTARRRIAERVHPAVCVMVIALAMTLVGPASASTDAIVAGPPSLAALALAPGDLGRGARVTRQGYVKDSDFASYYEREFDSGAVFHKARFLGVEADIGLAKSTDDASLFLDGLVIAMQSKKGRELIVNGALGELSKKERAGMKLTFGRVRRIDAGSEAVVAPMAVTALGFIRIPFAITAVRVDRVVQLLTLIGRPGTSLSSGDVNALLRVAATRMTSGLTPASLTPPTIAGTAQSGAALTGASGSWTNGPTGYAYTWLRCDATGGGCLPIAGATTSSYVLTDADIGLTLRLAVTATNLVATSTPSRSAATTPVVAAVTPPPTS